MIAAMFWEEEKEIILELGHKVA